MTDEEQFIRIKFSSKRVTGNVKVLEFKDNTHYIVYCPSLMLSSYGSDAKEAFDMLNESVKDYFMNLLELPEYKVNEELKKLGWTQNKTFKKKFHASAYVDKEGILRDFNLSKQTQIKETLVAV